MKIISYVNNYFNSLLTGIYGEENISRFLKMWVNYIVLVDIVNINILYNKSIVLTIYSFINILYMIYLVSIIKKAKYELFCRNIFGVILLYIILFTLFMGWNSGFANLMFGMTVSFFATLFFPKYARVNKYVTLNYSATYLITFFILFYSCKYTNFHSFLNPSPQIVSIMYFFNTIETFTLIIVFTCFYINRNNYFRRVLSRRGDFDALTDIYNRYAVNTELNYLYKYNKSRLCVAIVDIDFFKKVNDTYGHLAGDYILKQVSQIFKTLPPKVLYGRFGGEEFMLLSCNYSYKEFVKILEDLRSYIEKQVFVFDNNKLKITVSIGAYKDSKLDKIELLKAVDNNLYIAKESGRNRVISEVIR